MHSKYHTLLKSKSHKLDEEQRKDERLSTAKNILSRLRHGHPWYIIENIRMLYFYKDLELVRKELMNLYQKTENKEIKDTIKKLHDDTLDVSDLIEELEIYKEMDESINETKKELEKEELAEYDDHKIDLKFRKASFN